MSIKRIILFIVLTIVLAGTFYSLLDLLDRRINYLLAGFLSCVLIADLVLLVGVFHRLTKSPGHNKP